jgi:hypothetical protein
LYPSGTLFSVYNNLRFGKELNIFFYFIDFEGDVPDFVKVVCAVTTVTTTVSTTAGSEQKLNKVSKNLREIVSFGV